jgi:hypothetical protein
MLLKERVWQAENERLFAIAYEPCKQLIRQHLSINIEEYRFFCSVLEDIQGMMSCLIGDGTISNHDGYASEKSLNLFNECLRRSGLNDERIARYIEGRPRFAAFLLQEAANLLTKADRDALREIVKEANRMPVND